MTYLLDNKHITPPLWKFNKERRNYIVKESIIPNKNFDNFFIHRSSYRCSLSHPYLKKAEHTDYSTCSKEQLSRDLRVNNPEEQTMKLLEDILAENIKKGWKDVE